MIHSLRGLPVNGRPNLHLVKVGVDVVESWWGIALVALVSLIYRYSKIEIIAEGIVRLVLLEIYGRPNLSLDSCIKHLQNILKQKYPKNTKNGLSYIGKIILTVCH